MLHVVALLAALSSAPSVGVERGAELAWTAPSPGEAPAAATVDGSLVRVPAARLESATWIEREREAPPGVAARPSQTDLFVSPLRRRPRASSPDDVDDP